MIQGSKWGLRVQSHLKDILPDDLKTSHRPRDLKVIFPLTNTVLKTKPLIHEEYARPNCSRSNPARRRKQFLHDCEEI